MRKTRTFNLVIRHLEQRTQAAVQALLVPSFALEATRPQDLQDLGLHTLLLQEARQHQLTLYYVGQACYHGQQGSEPSDYEGATPYDPYVAMEQFLAGTEGRILCLTLSEDLQAYIARMPPMACEQGLGTGTTCSLPTHAFGELACGRAQLHQLAYYEQDLRQLHALVQQRAELHRIQELL